MPTLRARSDKNFIEVCIEEGGQILGFYDIGFYKNEDDFRVFDGDMHIFPEYRCNGYACMLINAAVKELEDLARFSPIRHVVTFTSDDSQQRLRHVFERCGYQGDNDLSRVYQ